MAQDFQRFPQRFLFAGISLNEPFDLLPPGKFPGYPWANMRSYIEGTLQVREGVTRVSSVTGAVTALGRLNDPTPYNGGITAIRVASAGTDLWAGILSADPLAVVDAGYSGDPLSFAAIQPVGTPQPYLYVSDRSRQRKVNVLGNLIERGIAPPNTAPVASLAAPGITEIESFDNAFTPWVSAGVGSGLVQIGRITTMITYIVYDAGTTGNATIALANLDQVGSGMELIIGGVETVILQQVRPATVTTTVAAILYDDPVANTGLCTIQPAASLGSGHIELPSVGQIQQTDRLTGAIGFSGHELDIRVTQRNPVFSPTQPATAGTPLTNPVAGTREISAVNFPVDCLVGIQGEVVRILSVNTGPDGIQSFRCSTPSTHVVGDSIIGIVGLRVYLAGTYVVGAAVTSKCLRNTLTTTSDDPQVGGIQTGAPFSRDLSLIGGTASSSGGGPGGPAPPPGDFTATVDVVRAQFIADGKDLNDSCVLLDASKAVAALVDPIYGGLLIKYTGPDRCGNFYSPGLCWPNGQLIYIWDTSASPPTTQWSYGSSDNGDRYSPLFGYVPAPPPPAPIPSPTVGDRATQPEDELHLSIRVDKLFTVQQITIYLDIDAATHDFTQNVYSYTFTANDIIQAIQSVDATAVTTLIDVQQIVVLPRSQTRNLNVAPNAQSQQLSLGNNQWMELRWKIGDMVHVGTDPTRSLANVLGAAILIQYDGKLAGGMGSTIQASYDDFYLTGGFGPDAAHAGVPYTYTYRYRSSNTGEVSNPAPPIPASTTAAPTGIVPRRQRVNLVGVPSGNGNADKVDWFRFGGTLPAWTYIGSGTNVLPQPVFQDDFADSAVIGGEGLEFDNYQTWPTQDLPRKGTCNTAGSAIQWVSGDLFNLTWAVGSQILVNGIPYTLYASPASSTVLRIVENAGALVGATFELPNATLLGANFPTLWGPLEGFYFAVGDPTNPGQLNWTKGNNPDVTSDKNTLYVSSPSTPLMNGYVLDEAAFVWSTEDLYRIVGPNPQDVTTFRTQVTPCGHGLWTRWGWCLTPYGPAFLSKDGIYVTANGSAAESLTDADLYSIFPHDGVPGVTIGTVDPPDMTQASRLRLAWSDGYLYFDYLTTTGLDRTLVYDWKGKRWLADVYAAGVTCRLAEPGQGVHDILLGSTAGVIGIYGGTDGDVGVPIPYTFSTPHWDGGDPRRQKNFGDLFVVADMKGEAAGVTVTPFFTNGSIVLAPTTIGAGQNGRNNYVVDVNGGIGQQAINAGIVVAGSTLLTPIFFLWEPSLVPKVERTFRRATDFDDAGYVGAKFVQGFVMQVDLGGQTRTCVIEYDNGLFSEVVTLSDAVENQVPYSFKIPFVAHMMRIVPQDAGSWLFYSVQWRFQPVPELVSTWITPRTAKGFSGYSQDERILVAHASTLDFNLILTIDGVEQTYLVPNSGGALVKTEVLLRPNKGKVYQYAIQTLTGAPGVRIYQQDLEIRSKAWNSPGPYQSLKPFGDTSVSESAARI